MHGVGVGVQDEGIMRLPLQGAVCLEASQGWAGGQVSEEEHGPWSPLYLPPHTSCGSLDTFPEPLCCKVGMFSVSTCRVGTGSKHMGNT